MTGENLAKLVELVARLRGGNGCAWDRAQNYDSMKGLLLEEAYEVIDAVNKLDFDGLEDELGDLLFHIVFYARLAEEDRCFTLDDVIERVYAKLVRRHPHVFGKKRARTAEEALQSWLSVKEKERDEARSKEQGARSKKEEGRRAVSSHASSAAPTRQLQETQTADLNDRSAPHLLDGIPQALPSTLEAYELGVRAAEVGFDWVQIEDLLDKVAEEVAELRHELVHRPIRKVKSPPRQQALARPEKTAGDGRLEAEVGDLLFAVSNLARYVGSDPESCLRRANQKFKGRFRALEQEAAKVGKRVRDCTPEELDRLWKLVKSQE
jgi:uncharacterized protein YabN with tetrapyrrole methylase and pyrophosphatase domain